MLNKMANAYESTKNIRVTVNSGLSDRKENRSRNGPCVAFDGFSPSWKRGSVNMASY
jgi:hypothetical protein